MNLAEEYRKKVLGCWMGKNIGGTLGGPFEGIPFKNNLTYYDPVPTGSMPNDDLELQAMYVAALDRDPCRTMIWSCRQCMWRRWIGWKSRK